MLRAVGGELDAEVEVARDAGKVDHVWVTMSCGKPGRVVVSVNTISLRNAEAGFDPRVWMGRVSGTSPHLPQRGWTEAGAFDYEEFARAHTLFFEPLERKEVEHSLQVQCRQAILLEAWGEPFRRRTLDGLHQIHSRRASCAVSDDVRGRDGGLKFYKAAEEGFQWTILLFKFCGQP
jgi:hypothetical protein